MIYLDNAATSYPKPPPVLEAVERCFKEAVASPGRGQHRMALAAGRLIVEARAALARVFGVANPADIVFTHNATEALNLAIKGRVRPGDTVVTTSIEHNSVYRPLAKLANNLQVNVLTAKNLPTGELDLKELGRIINRKVRLVVVTHASNVIGNILPIAEIAAIAHRAGVPLLVDASQTAGFVPLEIEDIGLDMVAFPGHKALLGPQGTGGLYINPKLDVEESFQGGTGSASRGEQPGFRPDKYESGTLNTPGIAGLGAAAGYLLETGVQNLFAAESAIINRLVSALAAVRGVDIYGPPPGKPRASLVSIRIAGISPVQAAFELDKNYDIAARAGWHCAPQAHQTIGTYETGTLRLSPGPFTTDDEIDAAIAAISEVAKKGK